MRFPKAGNALLPDSHRAGKCRTVVQAGVVMDQALWARFQAANPGYRLSTPEEMAATDNRLATAKAHSKAEVVRRRIEFEAPAPSEIDNEITLDTLRRREQAGEESELEDWSTAERRAA